MEEVGKKTRLVAIVLTLALCLTGIGTGDNVNISSAKKKAEPHLDSSKVRIDLSKKAKRTIHIKGIKKKNVKSLTVKSDRNKTAKPKLKDESKTSFVVKGKKAGKATITVTLTTWKKINKKTQFVMELAVTVVDSSKSPEKTDKPGQTDQPTAGTPSPAGPVVTGTPSGTPSVTPAPAGTPTAAPTATVAATQNPANTQDPSGGGSSGGSGGGSGGSSGGSGGSGGGGRTPTKSPIRTLAPTNAPTVAPIVPTRSPSAPTVAPATPTPVATRNPKYPVEDVPLTSATDDFYDPYTAFACAYMDRQVELALDNKDSDVEIIDATQYPTLGDSGYYYYHSAKRINWRYDMTEKTFFRFTLPLSKCFKPAWVERIRRVEAEYKANGHQGITREEINHILNTELDQYGVYLLLNAVSNYERLGILSTANGLAYNVDADADTFTFVASSPVKKENIKTVSDKFMSVINGLKTQAEKTHVDLDFDKALFAHEQTALFGEPEQVLGEDAVYAHACPATLVFNGKGDENAYTTLFNLIAKKEGLTARPISKDGNSVLPWNIVKVNGKWYHVDTYADDYVPVMYPADDPSGENSELLDNNGVNDVVVKSFFLLNDSEMRAAESIILKDIDNPYTVCQDHSLHDLASDDVMGETYGGIDSAASFCDGPSICLYDDGYAYNRLAERRIRMCLCHPLYRTAFPYARDWAVGSGIYDYSDDENEAIYQDPYYDYTWMTSGRDFATSTGGGPDTAEEYRKLRESIFFMTVLPKSESSTSTVLSFVTFLTDDEQGDQTRIPAPFFYEPDKTEQYTLKLIDGAEGYEPYRFCSFFDTSAGGGVGRLYTFELSRSFKWIYTMDVTNCVLGDTTFLTKDQIKEQCTRITENEEVKEFWGRNKPNDQSDSLTDSYEGMFANAWGVFGCRYCFYGRGNYQWDPLHVAAGYEEVFEANASMAEVPKAAYDLLAEARPSA